MYTIIRNLCTVMLDLITFMYINKIHKLLLLKFKYITEEDTWQSIATKYVEDLLQALDTKLGVKVCFDIIDIPPILGLF